MTIPTLTLENGTSADDYEAELILAKELKLHGDNSTMATLSINGIGILLTIANLRLLALTAESLADALEYGED